MTHAQREHARAVMDFLYGVRAKFDYPPGDQRTNRDTTTWHLSELAMHAYVNAGGRPQMDCSETCPWILRCAGAWPWSAPGYTGSHLATIAPVYHAGAAANVGALVIFGGGTGHHEAIVHTPDPEHGNPLLFSHGRPGADLILLHELAASQARHGHPGVRFLSVAHL